jgi:hypothetical protein
MDEIEIDVVGGSAGEIFGTKSPQEGESIELGQGAEAKYEGELTVKAIEAEAFRFVVEFGADFGSFAVDAALYEVLKRSGAKVVRIADERVEVDRAAIRERLEEVLGD